ncbi:AAA family ATPase [Vagococcus sp. JNUCC 83]
MSIEIFGKLSPKHTKIIYYDIPDGLNYLFGKNGTGKTMLLDTISGMASHSNYTVLVDGTLVYLNQNNYFPSQLKVREYLTFIYLLDGMTDGLSYFKEFLSRYDLNLQMSFEEKIGLLSGGERQFLYVLSILSLERTWYLLDEPFNSLDYESKEFIFYLLKEMKKQGKSVLLTSHESLEEFDKNYWNKIMIQ